MWKLEATPKLWMPCMQNGLWDTAENCTWGDLYEILLIFLSHTTELENKLSNKTLDNTQPQKPKDNASSKFIAVTGPPGMKHFLCAKEKLENTQPQKRSV